MKTTSLKIKDISCNRCVAAITAAVSPVPGVEQVDVDVPLKTVNVTGNADPALVRAVIEDVGYRIA